MIWYNNNYQKRAHDKFALHILKAGDKYANDRKRIKLFSIWPNINIRKIRSHRKKDNAVDTLKQIEMERKQIERKLYQKPLVIDNN